MNLFVVDIDDIEVDLFKSFLRFKTGLISKEIKQTIKKTNTVCVINKIDKFPGLKFPENVTKLTCEIENLHEFLFISSKEQLNISNLIFMMKRHVIMKLKNIELMKKKLDNDINKVDFSGVKLITKVRHRLELENCLKHLNNFLQSNIPV